MFWVHFLASCFARVIKTQLNTVGGQLEAYSGATVCLMAEVYLNVATNVFL